MPTNMVPKIEVELNANRCEVIKNKRTGAEFRRVQGDPSWVYLYERAKKSSDEFEIVYDAPEPEKVLGVYMYGEAELRRKNMKDLRDIAVQIGASGDSKDEIIRSILENQGKMKKG